VVGALLLARGMAFHCYGAVNGWMAEGKGGSGGAGVVWESYLLLLHSMERLMHYP